VRGGDEGTGAVVSRLPIFSARVIRASISDTRVSTGRVGSHHGRSAWPDDGSVHGLTMYGRTLGCGTGGPLQEKLYTPIRQNPPHFALKTPSPPEQSIWHPEPV